MNDMHVYALADQDYICSVDYVNAKKIFTVLQRLSSYYKIPPEQLLKATLRYLIENDEIVLDQEFPIDDLYIESISSVSLS